ncbi:hypothetical protein H6504_03950 [Candidatus Woesearchaeota archaeon]|nr:hypothetical protein [Candidatus Woesearchaeota archaeon]
MPDTRTHVFLRKDELKDAYGTESKEFYIAVLGEFLPDIDTLFGLHPKLRHLNTPDAYNPITGHHERIHEDAYRLSDILKRHEQLHPLYTIAHHKQDDDYFHTNVIMPAARELARSYQTLDKRGNKGIDIAHGIVEITLGNIIEENEPDITRIIQHTKSLPSYLTRDCAKTLADFYQMPGQWKSFFHVLTASKMIATKGMQSKSLAKLWIKGIVQNVGEKSVFEKHHSWMEPIPEIIEPIYGHVSLDSLYANGPLDEMLDSFMDDAKELCEKVDNKLSRRPGRLVRTLKDAPLKIFQLYKSGLRPEY